MKPSPQSAPSNSRLGSVLALVMLPFFSATGAGVSAVEGDFKVLTPSGSDLIALGANSLSENVLFLSNDGGESFSEITSIKTILGASNDSDDFEDIFSVGDTVISVGVNGLIVRSSDAGSSWSQVTTDPVFGGLTGVSGHDNGLDPSLWVAVGHDGSDGLVVRSVDDGLTWTTPKYISEAPFNSVTWTGFRWVAVGSDGFESGIIYESLDGVIWDLVSLAGDVKPLLDVSTDGSGTVIAVGESGEIVRSTDGGETFVALSTDFAGGGSFTSVIYAGGGEFFVGGDFMTVALIEGESASVVVPPSTLSNQIADMFVSGDEVKLVGDFAVVGERTLPLLLSTASNELGGLRLVLGNTLSGKSYFVETRSSLVEGSWGLAPAISAQAGNNGTLIFEVPIDGTRRFWRIVEL